MGRLDDLLPVYTASEAETREVGRKLAERLHPGDVVALFGDLGAGKTVLTKGICSGLGIDVALVTSPTFTIVNEYSSGSLPVYHFDAYRIKRLEEFFDLGYEDYFFNGGVSIIEWANKVEPLLPVDAIRLRLHHQNIDRRRILEEVRPADD